MPTVFTHPAVPLGVAPWLRRAPRSLVALATVASALPDVDVVSFRFGVPYEHPLGHRGVTHSLCFAALFAALAALVYTRARKDVSFRLAFALLFVAIASHGALDAMTDGGRGVGFLIPFSSRRFFFPFRPIRVSPIGATHFARRAAAVLGSELRWVWLPAGVIALLSRVRRLSSH